MRYACSRGLGAALAAVLLLVPLRAQNVHLVRDINPGLGSSNPRFLSDGLGTFLFSASDGVSQPELWTSDGSAAGTFPMTAGAGPFSPRDITSSGALVFFFATLTSPTDEALWKTDGTAAGTVLVKRFLWSGAAPPEPMVSFGGQIYFQGNDGATGRELWRSDGTSAGTVMVKDVEPGIRSSRPRQLTICGDQLFFTAQTIGTGEELWVTDGTAAGTMLVKDVNPGVQNALIVPHDLVCYRGRLYFVMDDGTNGEELWTSDGTAAGTFMVADINPSGNSGPEGLAVSNDQLFFAANSFTGAGVELWVSDGTAANTRMVLDINPGGVSSSPIELTDVGGLLLFSAIGNLTNRELWASDGTAAGTRLVRDIHPTGGSMPDQFVVVGDLLYFNASDAIPPLGTGRELWVSDGTASGTRLVADLNPGSGFKSSVPTALTLSCGRVFFSATTDDLGTELYVIEQAGPSAQSIGSSSPSNGPTLSSTLPILGRTVTFTGTGPVGSTGVLLISPPGTPFVLPGGAFGYVDLSGLGVLGVVAPPSWSLGVPLPNVAALEGLCVAVQAWWGGSGSISTSNGVLLGLGG